MEGTENGRRASFQPARRELAQIETEAVFCLLGFAGVVVWWSLFHIGMRNTEGRILGFPAWFVYSVLLGFLLLVPSLIVLVRSVFKAVALEPPRQPPPAGRQEAP